MVGFYQLSLFVYRLFFHPLRSVPGPWYAAISDLWISYHTISFDLCHAIESQVKKYGPVRIAPNRVMFVDGPTNKIVYPKFDKHSAYLSLRLDGNNAAITILDTVEHARVRRASSGQYVTSNIGKSLVSSTTQSRTYFHLEKYEPDILESIFPLVQRLQDEKGKNPFDCLIMLRHLMTEILVRTNFDLESDAVKIWASGGIDPLTAAVHDTPKYQTVEFNLPHWAWKIVSYIPHPAWQRIVASPKVLTDFVCQGLQQTKQDAKAGKFDDAERVPLVARILASNLDDQLKQGESADHLLAGIDTVATTLSYFCWGLACHPHVIQKLRSELDEVMHDQASIPKIQTLKTLPYLTAVIQESLRLYGTAPTYLPRIVPSARTLNILGYEIPPGTVIGTSSWSTHRQEDIYPSAETFNPDRWLAPNVIDKSQMIAFGYGGRSCAGENLAQMVLRIIVVTFVRYFDIELPKDRKLDMWMCDGFAGFPAGQEVPLVFKPRF
ncbi:cytochrome P450 [Dentipellis sp. KUC8613]|nr:cytochrome P450 [Dentipellis sp. KUC8613]